MDGVRIAAVAEENPEEKIIVHTVNIH